MLTNADLRSLVKAARDGKIRRFPVKLNEAKIDALVAEQADALKRYFAGVTGPSLTQADGTQIPYHLGDGGGSASRSVN